MMKRLHSLYQALFVFWNRAPALHAGCALMIGLGTAFSLLTLALIPLLFTPKKQLIALLLLVGGFWIGLSAFSPIKTPTEIDTSGVFHIEEIKRHPTPYRPLLAIDGTFKCDAFPPLPCRLYLPSHKRPSAEFDYKIGPVILRIDGPNRCILKVKKEAEWIKLNPSGGIVEKRFLWKEKVRIFAKKRFKEKAVQSLWISLLTGQKESRLLSFHFSRLGLSHLLAISGFHFALLSTSLLFLFRPFFSRKVLAICLMLLLSFYFVYMGDAPSIRRAYIGVMLFLFGILLNKQSSPFNALGMGLLAQLLLYPYALFDIGFELSFAATFGILLFYRPLEKKGELLFPKRSFAMIKTLPFQDQIGILLTATLKKMLALSGAVTLLTLPLLLTHFHRFPLASLFYNLFFPLFFAALIALFLLSLLLPFLSPLVEIASQFLLRLVTHPPKKFLYDLLVPEFPPFLAVTLIAFLFLVGIYLRWSSEQIKEWRLT